MKRHYEIEGALYPASDWANWAAVDADGEFYEYRDEPKLNPVQWSGNLSEAGFIGDIKLLSPESWRNSLTPATTELDRFCLRIYGSMFDKINTDLQRVLEDLHKKGGVMV